MGDLYFMKNGLHYKYNLKEFHFHTESEHTMGGKAFQLEMHMVHAKDNNFFFETNPGVAADPDEKNQLLVIAVIFQDISGLTKRLLEDSENTKTLNNTFINKLKFYRNDVKIDLITNLNDFARSDRFYYHYEGSLTTPPCNETVNWIVMTQIEPISTAQVNDFVQLLGIYGFDENNRGTKPLNDRTIYYNDFSSISIASISSYQIVKLTFLILMLCLLIN